jgi:spermidine/putrescine transport system substrate-binding protein
VSTTYDRRTLLKRGAGLAIGGSFAAQVLAACGSTNTAGGGSAGGGGGGGSVLWATNEAYAKPDLINAYEKASGSKVRLQLFSDTAEVTSKIKTGGTGIETYVDGSYNSAISYEMGILEPVDLSRVPNWKNVISPFRKPDGMEFDGRPYGVPFIWGTNSFAYNRDKLGHDINDLAALWDPAYKGKIAMPNALAESPQVAAMYLGIERPWDMNDDELKAVKEALLKQKPLVRTYWTEIGDLKNLFATGEVLLAWAWIPVLELKKEAGIDMVWGVPKQGQLVWWDGHFIPKGVEGKELDKVYDFIDYTLGDDYGVTLAKETGYRTTSQAAIGKMSPSQQKSLDFTDISAFLKNGVWFQPPTSPKKYEQLWNSVVNA